ncbi:hypothetical protein Pmani_031276 [Petrolisthes manimaculis]|uniref:UME domain-containing protein n=1 Tax=Petrolisthes manimaculis TaxID=1843537 RepID=A0AAE1TS55_9EUCA|nr:hypothetical protein Pmani_031276 [Petrolisthes manimaculis]
MASGISGLIISRTRRCAEVYCSHYRHSHTIHQAVFCSENQVNELVLGLHEHRGGVLQEFSHMKTIDPSVEQQSGVSSLGLAEKGTRLMKGSQGREEGLQEIADYLSPRLLGILGFLDSKLVSSSTMYKEKRSALWSLSDLLVLMGKRYISPVSRKILASLKTALKLKDEEFYDIGCQAWTNFLYNLDESTLVGLIEEVVAVMKPLVKKRPEEMAPVLTSVLVETPSVKEFLANMPLLPEDDSLSIINQAILEHQLKVVGGSTEEVLNEIHLNIESELFIVQLVTELGRAFLADTDANTQTCASYAMQEVTRLYGIRESGSGETTPIGSQAWEKLSYHLQEMIYPLGPERQLQ